MKKLMIATPAMNGTVTINYATSLAKTINLLTTLGIDVVTLIVPTGSLLVAERNALLERFYNSDCTHILCIDADIGYPAEAVVAMLKTNKDFVAGIYPARGSKNEFIFRPSRNEKNYFINDKEHKNLLKMEYIPAGFMLMSKKALQKMRDKHKHLYFEPKSKDSSTGSGYCLFNTEVYDGEFWGEDFVFCRYAREAGIDIWVDPLIQFDHAGTIGMLADCLKTTDGTSLYTISEAA